MFACAAAGVGALSAPPQLKELAAALSATPGLKEIRSELKLKLRRQQLLRATASQTVTKPRRYASREELVVDYQSTTTDMNPFHWTELPFRLGSLAAFYVSYPLAWQAVSSLPPPNPTEGGYFFSLMSIVFGTLTASTISVLRCFSSESTSAITSRHLVTSLLELGSQLDDKRKAATLLGR